MLTLALWDCSCYPISILGTAPSWYKVGLRLAGIIGMTCVKEIGSACGSALLCVPDCYSHWRALHEVHRDSRVFRCRS